MRITVEEGRRLGQMDGVHLLRRDIAPYPLAAMAEALQMLGELLADGQHRVERRHRLLRNEGDILAQESPVSLVRQGHEIGAAEFERARRHVEDARQEPRDDAADHALAGARFADQAQHLAGAELEIDVAQRLDIAPADTRGKAERAGGENGHASTRLSCRRRGSSVRRSPSPSRLKPSTVMKMASTGSTSDQTDWYM